MGWALDAGHDVPQAQQGPGFSAPHLDSATLVAHTAQLLDLLQCAAVETITEAVSASPSSSDRVAGDILEATHNAMKQLVSHEEHTVQLRWGRAPGFVHFISMTLRRTDLLLRACGENGATAPALFGIAVSLQHAPLRTPNLLLVTWAVDALITAMADGSSGRRCSHGSGGRCSSSSGGSSFPRCSSSSGPSYGRSSSSCSAVGTFGRCSSSSGPASRHSSCGALPFLADLGLPSIHDPPHVPRIVLPPLSTRRMSAPPQPSPLSPRLPSGGAPPPHQSAPAGPTSPMRASPFASQAHRGGGGGGSVSTSTLLVGGTLCLALNAGLLLLALLPADTWRVPLQDPSDLLLHAAAASAAAGATPAAVAAATAAAPSPFALLQVEETFAALWGTVYALVRLLAAFAAVGVAALLLAVLCRMGGPLAASWGGAVQQWRSALRPAGSDAASLTMSRSSSLGRRSLSRSPLCRHPSCSSRSELTNLARRHLRPKG